jgi:hypothetical protein
MIALRLFAVAIATGISVASDPFSSSGMPTPTKAMFPEAIRPAPFASSFSQDASNLVSNLVSFSRGEVNNQDGSTVQVTKLSFKIFSSRFIVTLESGIVNDSLKTSVPARVFSPEITMILASQCPLIPQSEQTCKTLTMDDTEPSTHDLVNDVLAWLANTLQAPRAAFRYAITALTPKSSVPARFVSSEIIGILAKHCPVIDQSEPTCKVPCRFLSPKITRILAKQCPLVSQIEPTSKADTMDVLTKAVIHSKQPTCKAFEWRDLAFFSVFECVWITLLLFLGYRMITSRVYRFLCLQAKLAKRAIDWYYPEQRINMVITELCFCKLTDAYVATRPLVKVSQEDNDYDRRHMTRRVNTFHQKAYEQGQYHVPTMCESLSVCYNKVVSFLRAEVHHFHDGPDETLRREIDAKCRCMLREEYTEMTGNSIHGPVRLDSLKQAVFEAHKNKRARRFRFFGRGR